MHVTRASQRLARNTASTARHSPPQKNSETPAPRRRHQPNSTTPRRPTNTTNPPAPTATRASTSHSPTPQQSTRPAHRAAQLRPRYADQTCRNVATPRKLQTTSSSPVADRLHSEAPRTKHQLQFP